MITYIVRLFCFCEIWALCVPWITFVHYYCAPCFPFWALFGSLVPAMWNRRSCAEVHELPQSHCGDNREGTLFPWLHIYYTHFASVRLEHSVCRWSLMTTNITLLALLMEHSLVHLYKHCGTVHPVPKCMSCHKAIVVITGRAHCFHDCIYIMLNLLLWDLSTLCFVDHLWPLILRSLLCLFSILWFIGTSKWNRTSCAQVHELPQSHCGYNLEGTLFSWLHIYYAQLASVRFEHSVFSGSLMTTNITLLALLVQHSLVHWYQQMEPYIMCPSAWVATKPLWW